MSENLLGKREENPIIDILPKEYLIQNFVNELMTQWQQLKNLETMALKQGDELKPKVGKKKGIFSRKNEKPKNNDTLNHSNANLMAVRDSMKKIKELCEFMHNNSKTEDGRQINAMLIDLLNGSDEKSIIDLTQILTSDTLLQRLTNKDYDLINAIKRVQTDKSLTPKDRKKYFEALNIVLNNNLDKTNPAVRATFTLKGTGLLVEKINILYEETKKWEEKNVSNKSEENKIIPKNPNEKSTKQKKQKNQQNEK